MTIYIIFLPQEDRSGHGQEVPHQMLVEKCDSLYEKSNMELVYVKNFRNALRSILHPTKSSPQNRNK